MILFAQELVMGAYPEEWPLWALTLIGVFGLIGITAAIWNGLQDKEK